ncbi:MAG: RrF2 family transcriptional regulator [Phycisphaerae bacterium]
MSKISKKCQYAVRCVYHLAEADRDKPISITEIADQQQIPRKFLEIIVRDLRNAELLKSYRGAKGGYKLKVAPSELTLADVVRAIDGPVRAVDCEICGGSEQCALTANCVFQNVWVEATQAARKVLEGTTFEDLMQQ